MHLAVIAGVVPTARWGHRYARGESVLRYCLENSASASCARMATMCQRIASGVLLSLTPHQTSPLLA